MPSGMIDIHSHILPGIDDGAQSLKESLALLQLAADGGVTTQVLTPHIQASRYTNNPQSIFKAFTSFKLIVKSQKILIDIRLSAEVRVGTEVMALVENNDFPWLGVWQGKKAFLLEMPHNQLPMGSLNLVKWLIKQDILPIIVHPERNREIQQDINTLLPYLDAGCELQITASSLAGNFGQKAKQIAIDLLKSDRVLFMATDCHNTAYRPPNLKHGLELASALIGEMSATALIKDNPEELLGIR